MDGGRTLRLIPTDKEAWHRATMLVAGVTLGGGVGWFVGESGSDAVVLAAVLPAVLSEGGFLILLRAATLDDFVQCIFLNGSMILFVIALVVGSLAGNADKLKKEQERLEDELDRNPEFLKRCSADEYAINEYRKILYRPPPLPSEVFCGSQHPAELVPRRTSKSMAP